MWMDRILAAIALAMLVAFLSVLVAYVKRVDLTVVVVIVCVMAAYDFYRQVRAL